MRMHRKYDKYEITRHTRRKTGMNLLILGLLILIGSFGTHLLEVYHVPVVNLNTAVWDVWSKMWQATQSLMSILLG